MRIVAGTLRGRQLTTPKHDGLRPTADRVRESVFNILAHGIDGFDLGGARVIDMFAGTGALGIEALSRGAGYCLFVEEAAEARALIRQNIEAFGLTGVTRIFRRDATDLGPAGNMPSYRLAFLDPPYGQGLADKGLMALTAGGWLEPGAVMVIEERAGIAVGLPAGCTLLDQRTYGDSQVTFARLVA
jgi:16S rRNA (guanine966-N2)-methyltransferase